VKQLAKLTQEKAELVEVKDSTIESLQQLLDEQANERQQALRAAVVDSNTVSNVNENMNTNTNSNTNVTTTTATMSKAIDESSSEHAMSIGKSVNACRWLLLYDA
jgi:flagellar biosynthesis chaperone FliJ